MKDAKTELPTTKNEQNNFHLDSVMLQIDGTEAYMFSHPSRPRSGCVMICTTSTLTSWLYVTA